jgi:hypothetical protein
MNLLAALAGKNQMMVGHVSPFLIDIAIDIARGVASLSHCTLLARLHSTRHRSQVATRKRS